MAEQIDAKVITTPEKHHEPLVAMEQTMAEKMNVKEKTTPEKHHEPSLAIRHENDYPFMPHDVADLPSSLPRGSSGPQQAGPVQTRPLPGAWAEGGPEWQNYQADGFMLTENLGDTGTPNMNAVGPDNCSLDQQSQGLVVATLVKSNNLPVALPQAHDPGSLGAAHLRKKKNKQCYACIVLFALLLLSAMLIILFAADKRSSDDSKQPFTALTLSPSLAPTSVEDFILALFPGDTVIAIQDLNSPQSHALEWLLADEGNYTAFSEERIRQRFALATLFFATKGREWVVNSNWLNYSVHECEWYTKTDFGERGPLNLLSPSLLAGFFPASEPLPSPCDKNGVFQHLWLDKNNLDGTIPEELYMLTSLKSMSLGANRLEGTISTLVGHLPALEGLVIKGQKKAGPIPTEIGILTNLKALILIENDHHGRFPDELWELTNLETLYVGRNSNLTGTIPSEIDKMSNLNWMMLHATGFTGTIPSEIANLQLSWLALPANQFSGVLPTELGLLSKLSILSFFTNALDGALPTELGLLSLLQLISLRDNKFVGFIPSELGLLTNLRVTLNLKNNQLSSTIPTELGMLINLEELEFKENQLTGQIPSELGLLTGIGKFTFANNSLTGTIPQELSSPWQSLHTLSFEGNALLSGMIPAALCSLNSTCVSSLLDPCDSEYGLSFDCSRLLCGCNCSCNNGI